MADNKTKSAKRLLVERSRFDVQSASKLESIGSSLESKKVKNFIGNEKIFFGRIDHNNDSIMVKTDKLTPIDAGKQILVINFVAAAFRDLQKRFKKAINSGQVKGKYPVYSSFSAKKGFSSPVNQYRAYARNLMNRFGPYVANAGRKDEITDFSTFFPFYHQFLIQQASQNSPITKSFFIKSNRCSPLTSGLAIEIFDGDHSDDSLKMKMFYQQKDFHFLKNIAYQRGFIVDKHIPWRLVADINSVNMQPFLRKYFRYNMNYDLFFNSFFDKATKLDFNTMIDMAVATYNTFVRDNPVNESLACANGRIDFRQRISSEDVFQSGIGLERWLDLYTRVRSAETQILYEENTIRKIVSNAMDLIISFDTVKGMSYINSKFDNVEHFGGSLFYDVTRYNRSKDPDATDQSVADIVNRSVQASNFKTY